MKRRIRRRLMVFFFLILVGSLVAWWSWPRDPVITFIRFEQSDGARWAVFRMTNHRGRTLHWGNSASYRVTTEWGPLEYSAPLVKAVAGFSFFDFDSSE